MWHLIFVAFLSSGPLDHEGLNLSQSGDYSTKASCQEQADRIVEKVATSLKLSDARKNEIKKQYVCVKDVEE